MYKEISVLGSTGSIGTQTLDIVRNNQDKFKIVSLAAGKNVDLLLKQIEEFKPELVSVGSSLEEKELKKKLSRNISLEILSGQEGLIEVGRYSKTDISVISVVGITGLIPTLKAIQANKTIALANKEVLVAGGNLVINEAKKYGVSILPVDSEHSAIFQCKSNNSRKNINKITITASGGPFRNWKKADIINASYKEALAHPNWDMGPKVSIDSATLMNKALEIIEAKWLFNLKYSDIEVSIHPQSIVHSMVEFIDGSTIAQLSHPTMHLPIQYALTHPDRINSTTVSSLNISKVGKLEFFEPDLERFPCLSLAYKAGLMGGTATAVLNASNEVAVNSFMKEKIKFYDIYEIVNKALEHCKSTVEPNLDEILTADKWARNFAKDLITSMSEELV